MTTFVSVQDITPGMTLATAPKGEAVGGTVTGVEARCDLGVFIVTTTDGVFQMNPFGNAVIVGD